jgi:hypothetical protein
MGRWLYRCLINEVAEARSKIEVFGALHYPSASPAHRVSQLFNLDYEIFFFLVSHSFNIFSLDKHGKDRAD